MRKVACRLTLGDKRVVATLDVVGGDWLAPGAIGVSEATWRLLAAHEGDAVAHRSPAAARIADACARENFRARLKSERAARRDARYRGRALQRYSTLRICHRVRRRSFESRRSDVSDRSDGRGRRTAAAGIALAFSISIASAGWPAIAPRRWWSPSSPRTACAFRKPHRARSLRPPAPPTRWKRSHRSCSICRRFGAWSTMEGGCIAWGGFVKLSPADDILIASNGHSKSTAKANSSLRCCRKKSPRAPPMCLIDIPVGPTAKVRSKAAGETLARDAESVGKRLGLNVRSHLSDGTQPVGRGIGPALEAHDLLAVFQNHADAPEDLRERALDLAGHLLEMGGVAAPAKANYSRGTNTDERRRLEKISGDLRGAGRHARSRRSRSHQHPISRAARWLRESHRQSRAVAIGQARGRTCGSRCRGACSQAKIGQWVHRGDPLFTLHAESNGELAYALDYYQLHPDVFTLGEELPVRLLEIRLLSYCTLDANTHLRDAVLLAHAAFEPGAIV